jgi:hypothetical protein
MIEDGWKNICGVHFAPGVSGAGAVWLAIDKKADVVHLWDCSLYPNEPPIMVATALNKHGRWIPIAWEQEAKPLVDQLLDRGCNTLPDPVKQTPVQAEAVSRDIKERMRTGRFKVDKRLADWLDEYKGYVREEGLIPLKSHPLMLATSYAMAMIDFARVRDRRRGIDTNVNYPKVSII